MSEGETAILGKLADVAQQQAVTMERLIGVLNRLDEHMGRQDHERDKAVVTIKSHVTDAIHTSLSKSDIWWRRAAIIGVGLIMLAIVIGAALDRFIPLLKH